MITMAAITASAGLDLGIPEPCARRRSPTWWSCSRATHEARLDDDVAALGELLVDLGAIEVYVLPPQAGAQLISGPREGLLRGQGVGRGRHHRRSWCPGPPSPRYLAEVAASAKERGALVTGCGHVGDGNVHLSVFQPDADAAHRGAARRVPGRHGPRRGHLGRARHRHREEAVLPRARGPREAGAHAGIKRPSTPTASSAPATCSTDRSTASMNGAQALIRTLVGSGVDVCFANPGTSEMHFVAALDDVPEMRAVLGLFEGVATGAADGYGRMARPAGGDPAAPRAGPRQRHRQPAQRPPGPHPARQRRRRPRHHPPASTTPRWPRDIESLARPVSRWFRSSTTADGAGRRRRRGGPRRRSALPAGWPPWWSRPTCRGRKPATPPRPPRPGARLGGRRRRGARRQGPAIGRARRRARRRQRAHGAGPRRRQPGRQRRRGQAPVRDLPGPARTGGRHRGRRTTRLPGRVHHRPARQGPGTWSSPTRRPRCRSSPTPTSPATSCPTGARCTPWPRGTDDVAAALEALADALGRAAWLRQPSRPRCAPTVPPAPSTRRPWPPPSGPCSPRAPW